MGQTVIDIKYVSTNYTGAPGYSGLVFLGESDQLRDHGWDLAQAFWDGARHMFPTPWHIASLPEQNYYDDVSGDLLGSHMRTGGQQPSLTGGSNTTAFGSGTSGFCINWRTNTVHGKRKVRGRTFLVPAAASNYNDGGQMNGTQVGELLAFANTLIDNADGAFGIWSRPKNGAGGLFCPVTSASVSSKPAVLRSRRA